MKKKFITLICHHFNNTLRFGFNQRVFSAWKDPVKVDQRTKSAYGHSSLIYFSELWFKMLHRENSNCIISADLCIRICRMGVVEHLWSVQGITFFIEPFFNLISCIRWSLPMNIKIINNFQCSTVATAKHNLCLN